MKRKQKGLLLIELLVSLAIISIIAITSYISVYPQVIKVKDAKIKAELNSVKTAFEDYYDDHFCFPKSLPPCGSEFKTNNKVYLKKFPCDNDANSFLYETDNPNCPKWYKITTNLKNSKDPSIDAVHCRTGCGPNCQYNYGISDNINLNYGCPILPSLPAGPSGTPQATETPSVFLFACTPSGQCVRYSYPILSECPKIYVDDAKCMNECLNKINRCKNEKGKKPADQ